MFVTALVFLLLLLAIGTTVTRGVGVAFSMIYIPTLLMFSNTAPINFSGLPDITPPMGVAIGMAMGLVLEGFERMAFRWTLMDTVIVSLSGCAVMSGWSTGTFHTGTHILIFQVMDFIIPYFAARMAFHSPEARRIAMKSVIGCCCFMALFAPIEMRLWPYYYNRIMNTLMPRMTPLRQALTRFGFFRAAVAFLHPIDFGNGSLVMTGLIATLASSSAAGFRNAYVQAGLAGGVMCLITSLSFGPFAGAALTLGLFFMLVYFRFARSSLVLGVLLAIVAVIAATFLLLQVDPFTTMDMNPLERSFRIRAVIVQNSWTWMKSAGFWGWGEQISQDALHLKSVDNTYMLFAMQRGWAFTVLWIAMPVIIAWRVQKSFRNVRNIMEVYALAASCTTILGINIAMFTVWAGSIYAKVWLVLVAFTVSLTEWFLAPVVLPAQARRAPSYAARSAADACASLLDNKSR